MTRLSDKASFEFHEEALLKAGHDAAERLQLKVEAIKQPTL
jgi:hypothetical protein